MPTLRTPDALAEAGLIGADEIAALAPVAARYAVAITPAIAELIETPDDPIGRQFLPSAGRSATSATTRPPTPSAMGPTARSPASSTAIPTACCSN